MKIHPQFWAGIIFSVGLGLLFNAFWYRFEGDSGAGIAITALCTLITFIIIVFND